MAISLQQKEPVDVPQRSLEAQLEYQKRLNSITNRIHSAGDTNDILLNLQDEILSFFDADRITIYVVDGIRKQIVSRIKTGDEINEIRVMINHDSIAGYCASTGKVVNARMSGPASSSIRAASENRASSWAITLLYWACTSSAEGCW